MGLRLHLVLVLCAIPAIPAIPAIARADTATEAKLRFDRGLAFYEKGRVTEALDEFFVSQRLSPNPSTAFNIASCLDALSRLDDAFSAYTEYLTFELTAEEREQGRRALSKILPKVARVKITSQPAGAAIFLDRKNLGQYGYTPRELAAPPGTHQVILAHPGYRAETKSVVLERGREVAVDFQLIPLEGRVRVETTPPGADIFLDGPQGNKLGTSPAEVAVPLGVHRLYFSMADRELVGEEVTVTADQIAMLSVRLPAAPPPRGRLRILSNIPSALVEVDQKEAGFSPIVLDLASGTHQLTVRQPGFRPWSGAVAVGTDAVSAVEVTLQPVDQDSGRGRWPWVLLTTSAVSGAVGAGLGVRAKMVGDQFRESPTRELYDEGRSLNVAADVMFGVALVGAAASAALFIFGEDAEERHSSAEIKR